MGKNHDPGSGSGMNIPDHISEGLETIFLVKILKFFDADPDPQYCAQEYGDLFHLPQKSVRTL
jgi:hypothetical protein